MYYIVDAISTKHSISISLDCICSTLKTIEDFQLGNDEKKQIWTIFRMKQLSESNLKKKESNIQSRKKVEVTHIRIHSSLNKKYDETRKISD